MGYPPALCVGYHGVQSCDHARSCLAARVAKNGSPHPNVEVFDTLSINRKRLTRTMTRTRAQHKALISSLPELWNGMVIDCRIELTRKGMRRMKLRVRLVIASPPPHQLLPVPFLLATRKLHSCVNGHALRK